MKLIFISGPSGSGKTTLSNKIIEKIKNGIVLSTDNYYKTGLLSKLISKLIMSDNFFLSSSGRKDGLPLEIYC